MAAPGDDPVAEVGEAAGVAGWGAIAAAAARDGSAEGVDAGATVAAPESELPVPVPVVAPFWAGLAIVGEPDGAVAATGTPAGGGGWFALCAEDAPVAVVVSAPAFAIVSGVAVTAGVARDVAGWEDCALGDGPGLAGEGADGVEAVGLEKGEGLGETTADGLGDGTAGIGAGPGATPGEGDEAAVDGAGAGAGAGACGAPSSATSFDPASIDMKDPPPIVVAEDAPVPENSTDGVPLRKAVLVAASTLMVPGCLSNKLDCAFSKSRAISATLGLPGPGGRSCRLQGNICRVSRQK